MFKPHAGCVGSDADSRGHARALPGFASMTPAMPRRQKPGKRLAEPITFSKWLALSSQQNSPFGTSTFLGVRSAPDPQKRHLILDSRFVCRWPQIRPLWQGSLQHSSPGKTQNRFDFEAYKHRLPTRQDGVVAQLVERLVRNEKVAGSNPVGSTNPESLRGTKSGISRSD